MHTHTRQTYHLGTWPRHVSAQHPSAQMFALRNMQSVQFVHARGDGLNGCEVVLRQLNVTTVAPSLTVCVCVCVYYVIEPTQSRTQTHPDRVLHGAVEHRVALITATAVLV